MVKNKNKAYDDCSVDTQWLKFSEFKKWAIQQDYIGKELDKDLLFEDNKVYGPQTCLFVSGLVNKFMTDRKSHRGDFPIGVNITPSGKYQARCHELGSGQKYLGVFKTPDEAHNAYRIRKYEMAIELASMQSDDRISKALLNRYSYK